MQPIKDSMSGLPVGKRLCLTGRRVTRTTVASAMFVLATLSLALFGSVRMAPPPFHSYATASHKDGVSMSHAGFVSPQFPNGHEVVREMKRLEKQPLSLENCNQWYGWSKKRPFSVKTRQAERLMDGACRRLYLDLEKAQNRVDYFRKLAVDGNGDLERAAEVADEFMNIKKDAEADPDLARGLIELQRTNPALRARVEGVQQFNDYMSARLPAREPEPKDELERLEREIRNILAPEAKLSEEEFNKLNQLAIQLDKALFGDKVVDVDSARFRVLAGVLDAARAAILRRVNEDDEPAAPEPVPEPAPAPAEPPKAEPVYQHVVSAMAGPDGVHSAAAFNHGPGSYVYTQSGAPAATPKAAEQPPQPAQQPKQPQPGMHAFAQVQGGGPAGMAAHAGTQMSHGFGAPRGMFR